MKHLSMACLIAGIVGCGSKGLDEGGAASGGDDTGGSVIENPHLGCIVDEEVCASYADGLAASSVEESCTELGGVRGDCPTGAEGTCSLDTGLTYHIYGMPSMEAEAYCDWLNGVWTDGDPA